MIDLVEELSEGRQNFCLSIDSMWFLPACPTLECISRRISLDMCESLGIMIGFFRLTGMDAFLILPPILRNPHPTSNIQHRLQFE